MSFGDGGQIASGGSTANNQSNLTVATTAAVNAGEFVAVAVTVDNQNATGGDQNDVSGVTIGGVALTKARQNSPALTAQTAAAASLWFGIPGAISSGANIIATFTNATTSDASALSARKFTVTSGNVVAKVGDNAGTATTTNPGSLDVTTANAPHLRIRVIGCEFDSTQSLTVTGSWTAWTEGASAASGTATEAVIEVEHRIVTAANSASAPTLGSACDSSSVYAAFAEVDPGTLAADGSSAVAFIGDVVPVDEKWSFTTFTPLLYQRTVLYPTWFEPPLAAIPKPNAFAQINTIVTFSRTILYPTLFEPLAPVATVASGTLAIAGSSTLAFIGSQVLSGTLTVVGNTSASFVGAASAAGTLTVSLGTAVAWVGSFTATSSGALIIQGSTTVDFIGRSTAQGLLSISGSTTAAFSGSAIKPTTLTADGSTIVAFTGRSIAQATLSISGSTTAAFGGSALKPTTLTISNSSTIAFVGRSTAATTLQVALGSAVAFVGTSIAAGSGTMIVSGSTTVAFSGRANAATTLSIGGSTTAAFVGAALETRSGQFQFSGLTDLAAIGAEAPAPVASQFTVSGSTDIAWLGEAVFQILVPPPVGYESQVGVWHVHGRTQGKSRWTGRTGKRYRIYGPPPPEPPLPTLPLWILDDGYWHDLGIWIDTEFWED